MGEGTGKSTCRGAGERRVPDRFLASAIDGLARCEDPATGTLVFVDYGSADVRELGAIYECLGHCRLTVAPPKAAVNSSIRVVGDKTKRQAAGAYDTPAAIVRQIIEHTVGPVLDRKLAAAKTRWSQLAGQTPPADALDELMDFRLLDPAMGSGYFLLAATDFIAERLSVFLRQFDGDHAKATASQLKHHVLARCIYGVDLDPSDRRGGQDEPGTRRRRARHAAA